MAALLLSAVDADARRPTGRCRAPGLIVPEVSRSLRGTPFLRKGVPGGPAVVVLPRRRAGQVNGGGAGIFATMEAFVEHRRVLSGARLSVTRWSGACQLCACVCG